MTGPSDIPGTRDPVLLLDEWEDGMIETWGWIEKTAEIDTPEKALAYVEEHLPLEDRAEEERYHADGSLAFHHPGREFQEHGEGPWVMCAAGVEGALEFWVIQVVCAT